MSPSDRPISLVSRAARRADSFRGPRRRPSLLPGPLLARASITMPFLSFGDGSRSKTPPPLCRRGLDTGKGRFPRRPVDHQRHGRACSVLLSALHSCPNSPPSSRESQFPLHVSPFTTLALSLFLVLLHSLKPNPSRPFSLLPLVFPRWNGSPPWIQTCLPADRRKGNAFGYCLPTAPKENSP